MDAELLRRAGGPVVVTALAGDGRARLPHATANGVRHYRELGADGRRGRAGRARGPGAARSRRCAGPAARAAGRLAVAAAGRRCATPASTACVADLLADGGVVSGSSAGAMVLCGWTRAARPAVAGVERGLGVVPDVLVLPHWSGSGRDDWLRGRRRGRPAGGRGAGLPEQSGVLVDDGGRCTAVGSGARRRCCAPAGRHRARRDVGVDGMRHDVACPSGRCRRTPGVRRPGRAAQVGDLFVRRARAGREPALFVHGLGGSATNWTDLMGLLAGVVDGEAVDLPGFGLSPRPAAGRTVGAHARAVVAHLERAGAGPVHLFGNSLGGAVSTRVAADRPDLVRTLTLVSPALPNLRRRGAATPGCRCSCCPVSSGSPSGGWRRSTPEQRARGVLDLCYGDPSDDPAAAAGGGRRGGAPSTALAHAQDAFRARCAGWSRPTWTGATRSRWRQAPGRRRRRCWSGATATGSSTSRSRPGRAQPTRTAGCWCCPASGTSRRWSGPRRSPARSSACWRSSAPGRADARRTPARARRLPVRCCTGRGVEGAGPGERGAGRR